MGCQVLGAASVSSGGSYVGGILGRGDGTYIMSSKPENLRRLPRYDDTDSSGSYVKALPISASAQRDNLVSHLSGVSAGGCFAGGLAGYLTTANVGGLLGDTVGVAQFLGFTVCDTTIQGIDTGYSVSAVGDYAGGGLGWATGGEVYDVELLELRSAAANNYAGGFAGATGPGDLVNGGGLDLSLLGISLLRANNVLSLASGIRTTYLRANVSGVESGFTVEETGVRTGGAVDEYMSGGWAAQANSVRVVDCRAENLLSVHANMNDGYAGGFVGSSSAGGLAGVAENLNAGGQLIDASQLVGAVPYLVPSYDGCYVRYVDGGYVQADTAGGFTGNFQSGKVNTYTTEDRNPISNGTYSAEHDPGYQYGIPGETTAWSVFNIDHVRGGRYAGGWGGKVYSGALASAGGGLSVLGAANVSISASELLSVASVYVPIVNYAGVNAPSGFTVYAAHDYEDAGAPASAGMAGGFIGYGSGVQISHSDVYRLRHGSPAEPASLTAEDEAAYARFGVKPAALESQDGGSYMLFDNSPDAIPYAVAGAYYAGGYIGFMDVGSAASVGDGLRLLGSSITLTNVLDALSVVVSTVEHSHVTGCPGGFSVVASPRVNLHNGGFGDSSGLGRGYAGGYAGKMAGGHIQDGNVNLFYYIIGEIAAGGYAGEMIPGDAASVLRDGSSLSLLGSVDNLASLVQDFVPTIRNSETNCVPCGGAVRAQCFSDDSGNAGSIVRGMAGGYVGHCKGGQIWGWSNDRWKAEATYSGSQRECAAIRIRSVYGAEYAGGFAGLAEPGSTASTGGLSLLGGLVNASNLLSALETAYPTIKRAAVYGPLEQVDEETWDAWVQYVGSYGGFYPEIARSSYAELENYIYGTHVVAGRHSYDSWATTALSGTAGGFVGSLHSGVIRHSRAVDSKLVISMRSSGGFAGELQIKGAAGLGSVELLGLGLNLGQVVNVLDVFVAEISESGTEGYQKGLTVVSYGDRSDPGVGMAGGFAGGSYGGQLGLHQDGPAIPSVWVHKLKTVNGTCAIGGFVGRSASGSLVDVDTNQTSNSFLQDILNSLVSTPNELASLGEATLSTIKYAEVSGVDAEWGFVVDGAYSDGPAAAYAPCAGGFAGQLEGAVLGERNKDDDTLTVTGLRLVNGGHYVGGFFGLGDTGSVAEVGGTGNSTKILGLLQAGRTTVADAFRTYIYRGSVEGVSDGLWVSAHDQKASGTLSAYRLSGAAGGFGGGLINGTVEKSQVTNLSAVEAPNYAAGFIGIMDRSGVLEAEDVGVSDEHVLGKLLTLLGLDLSANAEALAIVGSTVEDSLVRGYSPGFTATTSNRQEPVAEGSVTVVNEADLIGSCAAGFTGFGDVSQIERCTVEGLKYVRSPQIAAGFIGRGSNAYLVSLNATSGLTEGLLGLVNLLLRVLYINGLENLDLIDLPGQYAGLQLLADGNLLYINLFGLRIGVRLADAGDPEYNANSDVAIIVIGSSTIALPVTDGQIDTSSPNVSIDLIEGNRTAVKNCSVTGIDAGYDVFGGGAHQTADGSDPLGYAGGFVGYNNSGYFSHDTMVLCDTVRGTADKVGPFSGYLKYNVNTYPAAWYEGYDGSKTNDNDNRYSIYRSEDTGLTRAETAGGTKIADMTPDTSTPVTYNRYEVLHYEVIESHGDLENAVETGSSPQRDLNAYVSAAKAVLMLDTPLLGNDKGEAVAPDEMKDPCETKFDLNVHKKWRDYNDMLGTRPDELEIEIHVIDVGADPRMQLVQTIWPESGWEYPDLDLLEAQYGFTSDFGNENPIILRLHADSNDLIHWKGTLEGLPVAYETEGEIHYLQYVVVERVPEDYKLVEYRIYEDTASVVILNELAGVVLPGTGGPSYSSYYMLTGILLFIGTALLCIEHRRRRREVQNE